MSKLRSCIFPYCLFKGTTGFYKFPINDKNKLDLWLSVCNLSSVKPNDLICKNHFNPEDFHYGEFRTDLKRCAVPHWYSVSYLYQSFNKKLHSKSLIL